MSEWRQQSQTEMRFRGTKPPGMNRPLVHFLGLLLIVFMSSAECSKQGSLSTGTWRNLAGLDGCGWVIEIKKDGNAENLLPLNLQEFSVQPEEGKMVKFAYNEEPVPNICMAGKTIRLTSLQNK
jgi:hypothetical protein